MEAMVTRRAPDGASGTALNSDQAITLEEAVRMWTLGGAYARYQENEVGSIERGKLADFVVVNQDIFDVPIENVSETKVLSTVVGGKNAYVHENVQEIIDLGQISGRYGRCECAIRVKVSPPDNK